MTFNCSSATERICISSEAGQGEFNCINEFPVCGYYIGANSYSHIMGMWHGPASGQGLFTYEMYTAGYITKPTFSMLVDHNVDAGPHFSYIEFGNYNTASMRNVNDMTWLPNTAGSYWGNSITGFKYGAHSNTSRFPTTAQSWGAQTARLSSGWYDIVGPTAQIDAIR